MPPCARRRDQEVRVVAESHPGQARCLTLGVGLGASFITGANADGYGGALAERLAVDVATGRLVAFSATFEHARHALVDAGAYIPEVTVPAASLTGYRDYFVADLGFRYHIPIVIAHPRRVTASPWLRSGVATVTTSTRVDGAGFDGPVALRSNQTWPALSLASGAELRIKEWLSVTPQLTVQGTVLPDSPESETGRDTLSYEIRVQPSIDANVRF